MSGPRVTLLLPAAALVAALLVASLWASYAVYNVIYTKRGTKRGTSEAYTPDQRADQRAVKRAVKLPSASKFPWVRNPKWVRYYVALARYNLSPPSAARAYPAWPIPTDRLLSRTQKAALDPVHALKLAQIDARQRWCAELGAAAAEESRCSHTAKDAFAAATWSAVVPLSAVAAAYDAPDAYLSPVALPDI